MTPRWQPERQTVRLRNGVLRGVDPVTGKATVQLDDELIPGIPIHGPVPAIDGRVLLMEQGSSLVILGDAMSLQTQVRALAEEVSMLRGLYEELRRRVH